MILALIQKIIGSHFFKIDTKKKPSIARWLPTHGSTPTFAIRRPDIIILELYKNVKCFTKIKGAIWTRRN